jgi:hypothetical protein
MSQVMAATVVVVGAVALTWAIILWRKHPDGNSRWIPFTAVVAGLCLGAGVGSLAGLDIVEDKVGYVPVWLIIVAVTGFGFFLEMKGWNDHKTRTPVLGFATALVLMLAIGHTVIAFGGQEMHTVQTTSNVVPDKPPAKG